MNISHLPGERVVISPVIRSHGDGVVNGVRGSVSSGASGCRISYKNSGIIGTVIFRRKTQFNSFCASIIIIFPAAICPPHLAEEKF